MTATMEAPGLPAATTAGGAAPGSREHQGVYTLADEHTHTGLVGPCRWGRDEAVPVPSLTRGPVEGVHLHVYLREQAWAIAVTHTHQPGERLRPRQYRVCSRADVAYVVATFEATGTLWPEVTHEYRRGRLVPLTHGAEEALDEEDEQ